MNLTVEQFKEWLALLSDFTWPIVLVFVLFVYRDVVSHCFIVIIDKIFGRK